MLRMIKEQAKAEQIYSASQEGMALIWIEFKLDADPDLAVNEVQRKYNGAIRELPVEAGQATIQQFNQLNWARSPGSARAPA
ncbi:MAG: efflux RND transporter permease subunit [Bacillota bacterium]